MLLGAPLVVPSCHVLCPCGGHPWVPPRLGPARVIPWIRQSWAEPLVIPSGVGQGSAPPCLSVLGVTRGDSRGGLHRDTAPEGQGTGTPSQGHSQNIQLCLRIHRWDHVGTTQGTPLPGQGPRGDSQRPQGRRNRDTHTGTVCTHTDRHPTHPWGHLEGTRAPGDTDTQRVTPAEGHPVRGSPGLCVTHTQRDRAQGEGAVPVPAARQCVLHPCACGKWVRQCRARGWLRAPRLP